MQRRRLILPGSALLLAGALTAIALGGAPPAKARSSHASARPTPTAHRPGGPGLMGTLTSASGNTLKITLMPSHTSATVKLTSKTTYVVSGKTTKTRPTWKKGEQIGVVGTRAKNGTYTATSIMVGTPSGGPGGGPGGAPPGGPPPGGAAPVTGTVLSASSTSLVVKTAKARTTFKLTSKTRYTVNGKAQSKRPTFKSGETVHVMASKSGSTMVAQMVFVGSMPGPPSGGPPA